MKHYGIWLSDDTAGRAEWFYFELVIFCTTSRVHAVAQKELLERSSMKATTKVEVREFKELKSKEKQ